MKPLSLPIPVRSRKRFGAVLVKYRDQPIPGLLYETNLSSGGDQVQWHAIVELLSGEIVLAMTSQWVLFEENEKGERWATGVVDHDELEAMGLDSGGMHAFSAHRHCVARQYRPGRTLPGLVYEKQDGPLGVHALVQVSPPQGDRCQVVRPGDFLLWTAAGERYAGQVLSHQAMQREYVSDHIGTTEQEWGESLNEHLEEFKLSAPTVGFGAALDAMQNGHYATRLDGLSAKGWVRYSVATFKVGNPHLAIDLDLDSSLDNPWTPHNADLMATNWVVLTLQELNRLAATLARRGDQQADSLTESPSYYAEDAVETD